MLNTIFFPLLCHIFSCFLDQTGTKETLEGTRLIVTGPWWTIHDHLCPWLTKQVIQSHMISHDFIVTLKSGYIKKTVNFDNFQITYIFGKLLGLYWSISRNLNVSPVISFNLCLSQSILDILGLSWSFSVYLSLSLAISDYLWLYLALLS